MNIRRHRQQPQGVAARRGIHHNAIAPALFERLRDFKKDGEFVESRH
jgi:hypothetical protein